jgi:outer membrane receptor protein involved in Fe transport
MRVHWAVWASLFATSAAGAQEAAPPPVAKPEPSTTVVVTAKTPPVVHKIDRTVYDLKNIPQAQTGTVGDVLNTLPSVNVSPDGSVTVRGGSVQILIDGKPSAALRGANLATALQSMPANTIDKIEVITNPGAEFRTDAATVINIITRKNHGRKPSGNLVVNTAAQAGRANATLSGSVGVGKWTFNGSLSVRQDLHNWARTVERTGLSPIDGSVTNHMIEDQIYKAHNRSTSLDGGMAYAMGDKDSFNLNTNLSTFNARRWTDDGIVFLDPSGHPLSNPTTDYNGPFMFNDGSLTGTWRHQGRHDGETFTLLTKHEETESLENVNYLRGQTLPVVSSQPYRRRTAVRQQTDELSGDYILPLATDTQFKAGFDIESDREQSNFFGANIDASTGAETVDPAFTSRFLSTQTLSAAYIDYQRPLGKWLVEGGLRVENLTTTLGALRGALAPVASNLEWSPSLFISRPLTEHDKIKFTYSRRIDRPDPTQLNPSPQQFDAQDVFVGNASLHPAQTDSFEAGYDHTTKPVTFSGTAYFRQTRNSVIPYTYYSDPGDTVLITSVENAGNGSRAGLDMSLDLHLSPKVAYSLSSDIYRAEQTAPVDGVAFRQSIVSHVTKATITLTPTAADQFEITDMLFGPGLTADGGYSAQSSLNLAYTRTLSSRLKFVATLNNVLNTVHFTQTDHTPQLRNEVRWRPHDDTIFVGLNYKFGALAPHLPQ